MTQDRRWLIFVVAFVAAGVAVEAGVGLSISRINALYGARVWLANSRNGSVTALLDRMYGELERGGAAIPAGAVDPETIERHLVPSLRHAWLVADGSAVRSGIASCDGAPDLNERLGKARLVLWCRDTPVLLARVSGGEPSVYLGTVLGETFVDELKEMSLNEIELAGPHGVIATTLKLDSGARARHASFPAGLAFDRFEVELDGPYAGYFPETVQDGYATRLFSTGARRFEIFAYVTQLEPSAGPADLRIVTLVPADLLLLGPSLAGVAMVALGVVVTVVLALLARRLIRVLSRPLQELAAAARSAATGHGDFHVPADSGTFELVSLSSSFIAILSRVEQTQRRAAQSEKMAALGTLAGGVAHEINNPLGVILGFAQGLERRVPEGDALRMPVTSIVREALRCKALVQELLAFSRVGKRTDESVDVEAAVKSSVLLLGMRAKTQGVEIISDLDPRLPRLRGSRTQLQQVIVNLGTNALDVMKEGGTLTISARSKGSEIVLEVADTGTGIPSEIRGRIFEPFFTTKAVGEGTGLGLSLVYEIVQQHHGRIEVAATGTTGTLMRVTLPVPEQTAWAPRVAA